MYPVREQKLFEKIRALPEEKVSQVEAFVDSLRDRADARLVHGHEDEATNEAQGFLRLAGAVTGPEDLSSRRKAVQELSSFHLPVGAPEDLERESLPESSEVAKRARELVESGVASWEGGKPKGSRPRPRVKGKSASDIVLEDRR